jgi:CCR4-NOT complex subunit CAF16
MAVDMMEKSMSLPAVELKNASFAYPSCPPFIQGCSMQLPAGSRCLLLGANGAGKTTLLQLLAGKYMVDKESVLVLGRPPFHDLVRGLK